MGHRANCTYDGLGNKLAWTNARDLTTDYAYDPRNNLAQVTEPASDGGTPAVTLHGYDERDHHVFQQDPAGRQIEYRYIIQGGRILLTKNQDQHGVFYLLPGGGQNPGETVADALRRECLEELGARVEPGPLLFVRDYLSENHEFVGEGEDVHQVELMFAAVPQGEPAPHAASSPDSWQIGVEWVPLNNLQNCRLYPAALKARLAEPLPEGALYMGDVN